MEFSINFAYSVGPYDNLLNKWCTTRFCHCESSIVIDACVFRCMIESVIDDCFDPKLLESIKSRVKEYEGKLDVAFFILFGGKMNVRFLTNLAEDPFFRTPEAPVYECIKMNLELEQAYDLVKWNLSRVGIPYDIPRAVLLLFPVTLRQQGEPSSFFCSQLIMHMLRDNNLSDTSEYDINHMTPDDVYRFLTTTASKTEQSVTE